MRALDHVSLTRQLYASGKGYAVIGARVAAS